MLKTVWKFFIISIYKVIIQYRKNFLPHLTLESIAQERRKLVSALKRQIKKDQLRKQRELYWNKKPQTFFPITKYPSVETRKLRSKIRKLDREQVIVEERVKFSMSLLWLFEFTIVFYFISLPLTH